MKTPPIVPSQEWEAARQRLLVKETELTRARDACPGCSLVADQVAHVSHLSARDTTLAFLSHPPQPDTERLKARMPCYTFVNNRGNEVMGGTWCHDYGGAE